MKYCEKIRNFSIIAHIDHGKSTLADRFLELTGTIEQRKMRSQYLDQMPLEQERGITIKMTPVRMRYILDGTEYILNLIDTPGHVDFTYEVSRALAAVEGAILLVDATQGVQAQTLANLHLAQKERLVIIPVINKIDLPSADVVRTEAEIREILPDFGEILKISAKEGAGIAKLLEEIIYRVPPPDATTKIFEDGPLADSAGSPQAETQTAAAALRALVFDSEYDPYQGIIAHIRIVEGEIKKGERIRCIATRSEGEALEVGFFIPERKSSPILRSGEIGFIATGMKTAEEVRVGDTITLVKCPYIVKPLPGYREPVPMMFVSFFPENQDDYEDLRDAFRKIKLEDSALFFESEDSPALGRGFRVGFLGMLHVEIIAERLEREYGLRVIPTNPSVGFRVHLKNGGTRMVYSAARMPERHEYVKIEEPWTAVEVITPPRFLGALTSLVHSRKGTIISTSTLAGDRLLVKFEAPLREIITDFHDALKNASEGYASMGYELTEYREGILTRLDIVVAGERVAAFSEVVARDDAYHIGRERVEKLKMALPQALFPIALQAVADGRVLARATIPALKKDVTGYLYGGDRTRKMKLWKKQQKGKKRLKESGRVEIPAEVFLKMIRK